MRSKHVYVTKTREECQMVWYNIIEWSMHIYIMYRSSTCGTLRVWVKKKKKKKKKEKSTKRNEEEEKKPLSDCYIGFSSSFFFRIFFLFFDLHPGGSTSITYRNTQPRTSRQRINSSTFYKQQQLITKSVT